MEKIILCLVLTVLISGNVSAMVSLSPDMTTTVAETLVDFINLLLPSLMGGQGWETSTSTSTSTTSTSTVITTSSTSTTSTTTSTSSSTTSTSSSTSSVSTTSIKEIACVMNKDCGEEREDLICRHGDVYLLHTHWACRHPGTKAAWCIEYVDMYESMRCLNRSCVDLGNGTAYCVDED